MTDFGSKDWKDFDFPFFVADATGEDGAGIAAKEILGAAQGEEVFFPGLQGIAALLVALDVGRPVGPHSCRGCRGRPRR